MARRSSPVLLAAILGVSPLARAETPPTVEQLMAEIQSLKAKVAQLEARSATRADVDAVVDRVMRDAEKRSQLLSDDQKLLAGWEDGKFFLKSADGNFYLHPWLQFQFRDVTNYRQDVSASDASDLQNGFEVRRMKFGFDGNAFSKDFTYTFNWATDRNSGSLILEEAWAKYRFLPNWSVIGGQFKDPFAHESLVSSKKLLAAERTLLTDVFTGGDNFVQGVGLGWDLTSQLRLSTAFTDGANNPNTNFEDFPNVVGGKMIPADFGGAARLEYLVMGNWANYEDFTALGTKQDLLVFGGGADVTQGGDTTTLLSTADVQYESPSGLGLYGAFYGRNTENAPLSAVPVTTENLFDWGAIAQANYLFTSKWEVFGRYDFIHFDSSTPGFSAGAHNQVHELTLGLNYYIYSQSAKLTLDVTWLPNGSPVDDNGSGVLKSNGSEFFSRLQFQLLL